MNQPIEPKEESAKLTKTVSLPLGITVEELIDVLRLYPSQAKVKVPGPWGMSAPLASLQFELETEF